VSAVDSSGYDREKLFKANV
jgi:SWI/SNF-related matrix-associated actin-dependent regulator of chromatin subfamily A-like protein 1